MDERLLFSGVRAQVWMRPGITLEELEGTIAPFYRDPDAEGDLCVVLAAGNIASIAPFDIIHEMFNERKVVVVKMNPVNDYLGEYLEIVFADLIDDGYLRFEYGGVDVGIYLTNHPRVDSIHITGSASTYEAIVFGSGDDRALNKQQDRPTNTRSIEAELGGVGPVIIVPGPWSKRDLRYQAEQIVSTKMHNCGFNCIAAQVIVMPEGWEHTDTLIDEIRLALARAADRVPYYPGATDRTGVAIDRPSGVEVFGERDHRYLVTDLDANRDDEVMFGTEVFAPVLGVVTLPCPDVASYLKKAVRFANERLYGTLGANIMIHPRTEKRERAAFDQALADLRFGTIAINTWTGVAYFLPTCTWGAYPGHSRQDIQSGSGTVHNALMFGAAQKSVVRGPFAPAERAWLKGQPNLAPKPVFFVTNSQAHVIGERLMAYMDSGSKADLARVASAALRG
jgi:aldehyde dehydrogenase (NAD(P)+)